MSIGSVNRWYDGLKEPWRLLLILGVVGIIEFFPEPYRFFGLVLLLVVRLNLWRSQK